MATKTKPKGKPQELHTWSVNIDGQVNQIEAEDLVVGSALEFYIGETITQAVAPGHWATVELIEPDQDD